MTFSLAEIPDLTGKVALVTGANTGIGFETSLALAGKGCHVVLACRSQPRAQDAMDRILKLQPQAKLEFLPLDLKDLKQVETAAASFIASHPSLHVLINNAGIMACPFELTKDGIESQIATNHVGHFVLTMKLLGLLETSAPARIVNVSSMAHQAARKDLKWSTDYINDPSHSVWEKYGASKIANIYFSQTLGDKLRSKKITVNAAHPGWVDTELKRGPFDSYGNWFRPVLNSLNFMFAMKPAKGALTQLYVATSHDIEAQFITGKYFVPIAKEASANELGQNKQLEKECWDWTVNIVKEKLGMQIDI